MWPPEGFLLALWAFGSPYHSARNDGGAWAWLDSSFGKGKGRGGLGVCLKLQQGENFCEPLGLMTRALPFGKEAKAWPWLYFWQGAGPRGFWQGFEFGFNKASARLGHGLRQ